MTINKTKEVKRAEDKLKEVMKLCEKEGFAGIIFHRTIGHVTFYANASDRLSVIEIAKLEDEFIKQKRLMTASQMVQSEMDNQNKQALKDKKMPNYMG